MDLFLVSIGRIGLGSILEPKTRLRDERELMFSLFKEVSHVLSLLFFFLLLPLVPTVPSSLSWASGVVARNDNDLAVSPIHDMRLLSYFLCVDAV